MFAKVTIITVVFNGVKTLERTIKSVLNQTYSNIEYIIIDGKSTDGTVDLIKKYDNRISFWISEDDKGIYDAMNKGIKSASGDIIGIINADDYYHKYAVENAVALFKQKKCGIAHGNLIMVNKNGMAEKLAQPELNNNNYMEKMLYFHPTFFVNKYVYERVGEFSYNYKIAGDYDFFVRTQLADIKFEYSKDIVVYMQDDGVSVRNPLLSLKENRRIVIFHGYNKFVAYVIYVRKVIRLCLAKSFLGDLKRKIFKYLYQKEFVMPEIKLNPIIEEKKK